MKIRKFAAVIFALVMVFALAACSDNKSSDNSGNTGSSQNAGEQSATGAETKNENDSSNESENESENESKDSADSESEGGKILVAYFSVTNNTEGVAQKLADGLGADLYEITPTEPYTDEDLNYNNSGSRSSAEMNDPSARPAITGTVLNMEQYDVVFVGYPI